MNYKRQHSPDAENGASGAAHHNQVNGLPKKDADFMDVAEAVAKSWLNNPAITLVYLSANDFSRQVNEYTTQLKARLRTGSNRPSQTLSLLQLDRQIDAAVKEVKVYIERKFKKDNAAAEFSRYGILKENTTFRLPKDRNKRSAALDLMVDSITADGFAGEEYGPSFWQRMREGYKTGMEDALNTDGQVSKSVSGKNTLKQDIKKAMKSLRCVLEGNYPDSYQALYREWGWQKEKY